MSLKSIWNLGMQPHRCLCLANSALPRAAVNSVTPVPGDMIPSAGHHGHCTTDVHTGKTDTNAQQIWVLHILASTPLLCYILNIHMFNERRTKSSLPAILFTEEQEKQSFPCETFWKFSVNLDNL